MALRGEKQHLTQGCGGMSKRSTRDIMKGNRHRKKERNKGIYSRDVFRVYLTTEPNKQTTNTQTECDTNVGQML